MWPNDLWASYFFLRGAFFIPSRCIQGFADINISLTDIHSEYRSDTKLAANAVSYLLIGEVYR